MKNRFYKTGNKVYRDKISGYVIWEGLTRQEYGIPDWRVSKSPIHEYEIGGTFRECKEYLVAKFPITHLILEKQEAYIISLNDAITIKEYFTNLDTELGTGQQYDNLVGLTLKKAALLNNPDFFKEEMDHMIYAITNVEGVITPEYL